jgi:broad specificity phosphatase PhoE
MKHEKEWPDRLMVVRHGRSLAQDKRDEAELSGALQFELGMEEDQAPLVEKGRLQAEARGRWLGNLPADQKPTVWLVSPFVRARQTAEIILANSGIPLESVTWKMDPRLGELRHGDLTYFTRKGREQFRHEVQKMDEVGELEYRQPNGENRWDVVERLRPLVDELKTLHAGERVMVVSHSATIRCLRYLLEQLTADEFLAIVRGKDPANCSVTSYVRSESGVLVPDSVPYLGAPLV